jgi:hypothetical protein
LSVLWHNPTKDKPLKPNEKYITLSSSKKMSKKMENFGN